MIPSLALCLALFSTPLAPAAGGTGALGNSIVIEDDLPVCVLEFLEAARARESARLVPLLAEDSAVTEVRTLFDLLGQAPFTHEVLEVPFPNGHRALARIGVRSHGDKQISEFWFWLTGQGSKQRILSVQGDPRDSRDWLYEQPKPGVADSPEAAARLLFDAMQQGDERTAERCTSDVAWRSDGGDLHNLFVMAHTAGLGVVIETPQVRLDRAALTFGFEVEGQRQGEATLYLEQRGTAWLATGFGNDRDHTAEFLAGHTAATVWPKSPFDAYQEFGLALLSDRWIRMGAVSTPEYWRDGMGRREWQSYARERQRFEWDPKSVRVTDHRAMGTIELHHAKRRDKRTLYVWLQSTPDGWRVVGHSANREAAEQFLAATEDHPRPR